MEIPFVPDMQLPRRAICRTRSRRRPWHFRQSIDYSMTANCAVLDLASNCREHCLYNIYRMGKNAIDKGNRDTWTIMPKRIEAVKDARSGRGRTAAPRHGPRCTRTSCTTRRMRDPRGFIIPPISRIF